MSEIEALGIAEPLDALRICSRIQTGGRPKKHGGKIGGIDFFQSEKYVGPGNRFPTL